MVADRGDRTATKRRLKEAASNAAESGQANGSSMGVLLIILAMAALLVAAYVQITRKVDEKWQNSASPKLSGFATSSHETLVVADNMDAGYLDHVVDALEKYGHKLTFTNSTMSQETSERLQQFDLIWTHDYPFQTIKKPLPHQRFNHFPGTGFITNKLTLSTTPNLPHQLRAFRMPLEKEQFVKYSKEHSSRREWIQKSSSHRGISIETTDSVDLDANDTLIQEYMSNPLLIDGKKFDIGIYVVLTSVEPLRVYIYESESLLRFCARPYLEPTTNSFNSSDLDSYVVGDDYTPIWLMPSLLRYYIGTNLSMKQTLNAYLRALNKDGNKIWQQIDETIKSVYKLKEHHVARLTRMYQGANNHDATSVRGSLNQFFEMVRFDFIVDEDLNVYLMEANMSPNLSSRHFPPNRLLYEQVLNSYFSLVGLTEFARRHLSSRAPPVHFTDGRVQERAQMDDAGDEKFGLDKIISEKELSVYEELCASDECHMNCHKVDCRVCYFCLSDQDKHHLRRAIFEQLSRWNFKRLLPSTRDEDLTLQMHHPDRLTSREGPVDSNYIHVQWFRGKCFTDARFCSY